MTGETAKTARAAKVKKDEQQIREIRRRGVCRIWMSGERPCVASPLSGENILVYCPMDEVSGSVLPPSMTTWVPVM